MRTRGAKASPVDVDGFRAFSSALLFTGMLGTKHISIQHPRNVRKNSPTGHGVQTQGAGSIKGMLVWSPMHLAPGLAVVITWAVWGLVLPSPQGPSMLTLLLG